MTRAHANMDSAYLYKGQGGYGRLFRLKRTYAFFKVGFSELLVESQRGNWLQPCCYYSSSLNTLIPSFSGSSIDVLTQPCFGRSLVVLRKKTSKV